MLSQTKRNKLTKLDDIFKNKTRADGIPPYIVFNINTTAKTVEAEGLTAEQSKKLKVKAILEMFRKCFDSTPKGYVFNNEIVQVPVWMKDFPPSKYGFLNEVGMCVFAREKGDPRYILFPDESFEMFNFKTYDEMKKEFEGAVKKAKKQSDDFYFQGTDSTRNKNHHLRAALKEAFPDKIKLTEKEEKENITEVVKYKYVLSLPGSNIWNDRLKFLILASKSTVVNVKITVKNLNSGFVEKANETFLETAFLKGKEDDYTIPLEMEFYDYNDSLPNNESVKDECEKLNAQRIQELVSALSKIKKAKKPKKKVPLKEITSAKVYQYVNEVLIYFDTTPVV